MREVWMQSRFGKAIDLVSPREDQVDFMEICRTLADINRFGGHAAPNVSVAFHTLIGVDICPPEILPLWLAHDMHEDRIGDITTPQAEALAEIAKSCGSPHTANDRYCAVSDAIKEAKLRHDSVIHSAAGLPLPTAEQKMAIRKVDLRCLVTERRDFMAPTPRAWHPGVEMQVAAPNIYRDGQFGTTPGRVAWRLYALCVVHFPKLRIRELGEAA